ncbi:MAG: NUDIX hydrolase [Anaerolineae bacterium]|nr:MAG: NUDIX hydrolase [Anaerolineae bacterium]
MKHKPWKTRSSRPIYQNPWIDIREDVAEMPDGRTTIYGVVSLGQCVGVVPFLDEDRILMVRQYRYVQEDARWEIPTGGVHEGESLEDATQRELQEETGYRAEQLTWISSYYTSKSVCKETAHLYIGEGLSPAERPADETEFIEVKAFLFSEALQMVIDCEIMDSMSVIAILHVARLRGMLS